MATWINADAGVTTHEWGVAENWHRSGQKVFLVKCESKSKARNWQSFKRYTPCGTREVEQVRVQRNLNADRYRGKRRKALV